MYDDDDDDDHVMSEDEKERAIFDMMEYMEEEYERRHLERDTYYALTDGQYGDYDEWRENGGDEDSLMDSLGY